MNIYRWSADEKSPDAGRQGGVYLIMDAPGDPLYIGVCCNWTDRRRGHVTREYWPLASEIVMLTWDGTYAEWEANETRLIQMLRPPYNRRHARPDSFRLASLKSWETRRRNQAAKTA